MAALLARPDARVAIINRGPSQNIDDYARQFLHFSKITVDRIEAIRAYWFHEGRRLVRRETHALLDFPLLSNELISNGFITGPVWHQPPDSSLSQAVSEREARSDTRLVRYEMTPS
jgi:hypothetical protein